MLNALVLSLAWFAAINIVVSGLVWAVAHRWPRAGARPSFAPSARGLLGLRLLPAAASLLFVFGIFAPAHWRFEPRGVEESFGWLTYALAAAGASIALRAAARALRVVRAARGLRGCDRLPRLEVAAHGGAAVYEVSGLAGVSLAGILRPRILVGDGVRRALTEAELQAAVAHENAHRTALDNVKRFLVICAPDLLGGTAAAARLESAWRAAAEWQADARAVDGDDSRAVHLASALVKVSRLAAGSRGPRSSPAWSTLHEAPLLERRVRRLIAGAQPPAQPPSTRRALVVLACACAAIVAVGGAAAGDLHLLTETLAHWLP